MRYTDPVLLGYLQDGVSRAFALRPDLRFGQFLLVSTALALGTTFPLPVQHESVIADYVIFRAETADDENVNTNRETKHMQMFEAGILKT